MNYENNLLSILSWASTRATWVSVSSCAQMCNIEYDMVHAYVTRDDFGQVADFYHYEYRIRWRPMQPTRRNPNPNKSRRTYYISVVSRGYI